MRFGTAGVPLSAEKRSSESGIRRIAELGLSAMELEFVHRVSMGRNTASAVKEAALEHDVALTVHAPYYINLNSSDEDKLRASKERLIKAAVVGFWCGASRVTFHPAFYHDDPPEQVFDRVKENLQAVRDFLASQDVDILLCPETTGSVSQFGTLEEVLELCAQLEGVEPCIDFAHLYARSGGTMKSRDFAGVLETVESKLGGDAIKRLYIHLSGIEYNGKGEVRHLELGKSHMPYEDLLGVLSGRGADGIIVCESPNLEEDALLLQKVWNEV